MRKSRPGERTRWLNTPNVYQKVEMLETGTNDPKTIYKVTHGGCVYPYRFVHTETFQVFSGIIFMVW